VGHHRRRREVRRHGRDLNAFVRPVLVDKRYSVEAHLSSQNEERIETAAVIRDTDGKLCAETTASFAVLGAAQAVRATGADESALDPAYLK